MDNTLLYFGRVIVLRDDLSAKRDAYDRAKADFDKKWKKTAQAEMDNSID